MSSSFAHELLLVPDVKKAELFGEQPEVVFLEISRRRLAGLGIHEQQIYRQLQAKSVAADGGRVRIGDDAPLSIRPAASAQQKRCLSSRSYPTAQDASFFSKIATLKRSYEDPPRRILRYDGQPAIGLGSSTAQGANVVSIGNGHAEDA